MAQAAANGQQRPTGADIAKTLCEELFTEEFFEKYWEKAPLHVRAAGRERPISRLPEALTVDDAMTILRYCGPNLKMFRRGESCDSDNFLVGYLHGASLIVNQADRFNETIYTLCRGLADRFFNHVFAVVYLTPAQSHAVRLHNDDQDVFLMQVWGKKRWKVRDAPQLLCYTEEMLGKDEVVPKKLVGDPVLEFTIEPGDILYMPRGFLHEATTGEEPSLHVTITIPTSDYCWGVQLVKHFMQELHKQQVPESLDLGSSLCRKDPGAAADTLDAELRKLLEGWTTDLKPERVVSAYEQRMVRTNEGQERQFSHKSEMKLPPCVAETTRVRLMYGVRCRCEEKREVAVFSRETDGSELEMPVAVSAMPLLKSLTNRPRWVTELPCADAFERLCILQLLNQQGVVQLFLKGPDD